MQQRDWLYFLLDKSGKSYRIENGTVVAKSLPAPLHYTPDGWQDITIGWERDIDKFGNVRNFTLPLSFVKDGQSILRDLFYKKNFNEALFLLIQKEKLSIDDVQYYFYYDFFYRGQLDLTTSSDEEDKFSISIDEGGISKAIKSLENQEYEIPVDEIDIQLDGMLFHLTANFLMVPYIPDNGAVDAFFPAMANTENDGDAPGIITQSSSLDYQTGVPWSSLNWIIQNVDTIAHSYRIHGEFLLNQASGGSAAFHVTFKKTDGNILTGIDPVTEITGLVPGPIRQSFPFDATVTLQPGERGMLEFQRPGTTQPKVVIYESKVQVEVDSKYKTTYAKALYPLTLLKRLIAKITGDEENVESDLLDAFSNLAVTCGDALRGFEGAVIKTKLSDFFQSYGSILCGGSGIVLGKYRFEYKDSEIFVSTADQIPLGRVKGQKITAAKQFFFNKLKIGYPDQNINDVNGRQEWNTTSNYSCPLLMDEPKEYNAVSVYRADPFGVETIRRNLSNKDTTDADSDNDVFIINIDLTPQDGAGAPDVPDTFFKLRRDTYDEITGILSPETAFNIEDLTPARMLDKWRSYLNSVFYGFAGQQIVFQTSDKNRSLYTKKAATMITPVTIFKEDANFTIGDSPRFFIPYIAEFQPEEPVDLVEKMTDNPNRCFNFIANNGLTYSGFNLKVGIAPSTKQEQGFQLFFTNENDITTLAT